MHSVIGKLDLDNTFVERDTINATIVDAVDKASDPWGATSLDMVKISLHHARSMKQWKSKCVPNEKKERKFLSQRVKDRPK